MPKKISIIGSGFSGLSAAACLAHQGHAVNVFEKNAIPGGRARQFQAEGFTFDMGPTWYWMPEVFEQFYNQFGHKSSDFYELKRIDPSYRVFFGKDDFINVPASMEGMYEMVEGMEPGSAPKLKKYLQEAERKYQIGMGEFVYKPGLSFTEFLDVRLLKDVFRLNIFQSMKSYVAKYFSNPRLQHILEFPVLFLGAKPAETPALYSLMNYAEWSLGTWYPVGGMFKIVAALTEICKENGVQFHLENEVYKIHLSGNKIHELETDLGKFHSDVAIGSADYHHVEQQILPASHRMYSPKYWDSRQLSPTCLIFYLGLNKKLDGLLHHNIFFDADFSKHLAEIYDSPQWPENPLFYVCSTSKTDDSTAPKGCENLYLLVPVAPGLKDTEEERERIFRVVMQRLEHLIGEHVAQHITFKRSFAHNDFSTDYKAFKGNGFGLANTLMQTAIFKPKMRSKKIKNLFYAGQLTAPGPGVPPSLISGQVAAKLVAEYLK